MGDTIDEERVVLNEG